MKYIKDFIIGSSILVVAPFLYIVHNSKSAKSYSYYQYSFAAPLWFGVWNVLSLIIAEKLGLSKRLRFLLISLLSYLSVLLIVTYLNTYKFTSEEWRKYYLDQLVRYFITWNIVIFYLDKYI